MSLEAIYQRLPVPLQNLAASIEGFRIQRKRFNARFQSCLEEYSKRSAWSTEEVFRFRDQRLVTMLRHAAEEVPHFQEVFRAAGVSAADISGMKDLSNLPILTKREIQQSPERFTSRTMSRSACFFSHTSGTTGAGLRFPVTWESHREQWAVWWRYRKWHGLSRDMTCAYFGGRSLVPPGQARPPFWRRNLPGRQILFSAYHLSPDNAGYYIDELRRSGAVWLHGYPSVLSLLASFVLQAGETVPMRFVTTGAENLLAPQSALIEKAFGVRPLQHYGLAEGVANISMCPRGKMHVDEDYAAVEFLPNEAGGYRIVGTNLTNYAMPFIRYETGDVIDLDDDGCSCGLPGRIVKHIDGRQEDFVIARSGARLGRLDHIFKDQVAVREAQIRQDKAGSMTVHVVKGPGYGARDEANLRAEILKRVGNDVDFEIVYSDHIQRTAAGKLRFVVSTLREGAIEIPDLESSRENA